MTYHIPVKTVPLALWLGLKAPYSSVQWSFQSAQIRIAIRIHSSKASTPFDLQGGIVCAPLLAKMAIYMYKSFAESALLIGVMLLSFDPNLHRHPQCQSVHTLRILRRHRRGTAAAQNGILLVEKLR
jgi:hypothetical protein